jgi:hypothetical protein
VKAERSECWWRSTEDRRALKERERGEDGEAGSEGGGEEEWQL